MKPLFNELLARLDDSLATDCTELLTIRCHESATAIRYMNKKIAELKTRLALAEEQIPSNRWPDYESDKFFDLNEMPIE